MENLDRSMSPALSTMYGQPLPKKRIKKRPVKSYRKPQPSQENQSFASFVKDTTYQLFTSRIFNSLFDGDKFPGGFGTTKEYLFLDYWELRERSVQLFTENLYAAGLINRLVTNIINTGLSLEASPVSEIIGIDEDILADWSENVENLYRIWGNNKDLVDWKQQSTEGELQEWCKKTALISGDCLIVIRQSPVTGLPVTEIIDGRHVQNPVKGNWAKNAEARGNKIIHGVEVDKNGRHVAYYVNKIAGDTASLLNLESSRIPANGPKSGRKIAWLVYGSKRLLDDIRGIPLLGLIAQSLKEIDRYRDSEQRAAVVNSILAMYIKKGENKPGTRPMTGGAVRKGSETIVDQDGTTRDFAINKWIPGMTIDELQMGEEPVSFDTKRPSVNFAAFEDALISAISWSTEIPPEILKLSFNSNYSSSRMASSEFKMLLDKERLKFASDYLKPRYENWLVSMVLTDRIKAPGLLEAWRDISKFEVYGAWIDSDWSGAIKPHVDPEKETRAYVLKDENGYSTKARSTRELTGMKWSRNIKQIEKENIALAKAHKPLIDAGLMASPAQQQTEQLKNDLRGMIGDLVKELIQEHHDMEMAS